MPSLSERLPAELSPRDFELAIKVCALVEAFQAAEQARKEAARQYALDIHNIDLAIAYDKWNDATEAAKARLLEVNLG